MFRPLKPFALAVVTVIALGSGRFNRSTQHLLFHLIGQEMAQMTRTIGRGLSASQKKELWERWKRGQSSNDIARALAKHRGSVHFVLSSSGGIEPPRRRRSRLALSV